MHRLLLSIASAASLLPLAASQDASEPSLRLETPAARKAAVEVSLLPRDWVEGHAFGIDERMRILGVPGVSVAVIHNGQIDWAAGYGERDVISGAPVTAETLFQAASISKSVSALVTLRLAQEGKLDLDAPISDILTSYALPDTDFKGEVTPRRLLNHTAGLNVGGFGGYRTSEPIPSVAEVVAGLGNSDPVRRIENAGEWIRYSGGGSTLLQLALMDLTDQDFTSLTRETVITPLGMTHSTYAQPLPTDAWPNHSGAHTSDGRQIPGGFHVYPEQYPAGLWTTPSDIARFALEVQRLAAGQDGQVLDAASGRAMLTPAFGRSALGLFISEYGGVSWFGHSGSNEGFKCDFRASFDGGHGVVVMTNSDTGFELCQDIIRAVAEVYHWPDVVGDPLAEAPLSPFQRQGYAGRYSFGADEVVLITAADDRLTLQQLPYPRLPLAALGNDRFRILGSDFHVTFERDRLGETSSLAMSMEPDRNAHKLASDAYWPVQDLLLGRANDAVAGYREAHSRDANDPIVDCDRLIQLTRGILTFGTPTDALTLARAITEFYPRDAGAWDVLGETHAKLDDHEQAIAAYRTCATCIPDDTSLDAYQREWLATNAEARLRWLEAQ